MSAPKPWDWVTSGQYILVQGRDYEPWERWWNRTRVWLEVSTWQGFDRVVPRRFGRAYDNWSTDTHVRVLRPFHLLVRVGHWCSWNRWFPVILLMKLGFLQRDVRLTLHEQGYYRNLRWQWRFWRGPYYEAAIALGLTPPSWRESWKRW